tara:strand:+ start:250 stop:486 length:237 start_codon:yes stop_codon:yes gene_type:complete
MRKTLDILTIVTSILTLSIIGTGFFTYKYLTSDGFKKQAIEKIMGQVSELIPDLLDEAIPNMTGGSIPIKKPDMKFTK